MLIIIFFFRIDLLLYCNSDCQCSKNAYFRPICDSKSSNTYYSPCHAGCTVVDNENGTKTYSNCTCIDEHNSKLSIIGNLEARDGACDSESCQFGWLIYEVISDSLAKLGKNSINHYDTLSGSSHSRLCCYFFYYDR